MKTNVTSAATKEEAMMTNCSATEHAGRKTHTTQSAVLYLTQSSLVSARNRLCVSDVCMQTILNILAILLPVYMFEELVS